MPMTRRLVTLLVCWLLPLGIAPSRAADEPPAEAEKPVKLVRLSLKPAGLEADMEAPEGATLKQDWDEMGNRRPGIVSAQLYGVLVGIGKRKRKMLELGEGFTRGERCNCCTNGR